MTAAKTEIYRKRRAIEAVTEVDARRAELCTKLGMELQAQLRNNPVAIAAEYYPRLSENDAIIWGRFLTKAYSKAKGEWKDYAFDVIPVEILDEIEFATKLGIFTDIQIRTVERGRDPAAFGGVGNDSHFLICRWGESLVPFEEIRRGILVDNVYFFFGGSATFDDLPAKIQEYCLKIATLRGHGVWVNGRSRILHRHCGQPMWEISRESTKYVCEVCGHTADTIPAKVLKRLFGS